MRSRLAGFAALLCVALAVLAHAQQCEVDLHMVFDTSGSMDDKDPACLEHLRSEVLNDPSYQTRKPCWELITAYARTSHDLVRSLCNAAGQPDPRVSMVQFRCIGTGKDRKILLEPSNDPVELERAFSELDDQMLSGQSCAVGALDQVRNWTIAAYNLTNREAGVSSAVGDPDALATKRPVVLLVTDGLLGGNVVQQELARTLREDYNVTLVAANVFPDAGTIERLSLLTERGFILDAAVADALKSLSIRVGSYVTRIEDLETCSGEQLACARARRAALNASDGDCAVETELYTALASCAAAGCVGLDLTADKDACLAQGGCDCADISTHVNAQNYGPDGESGFGFEADAPAAGFMATNRASAAAMLDGSSSAGENVTQLQTVFTTQPAGLRGGLAAPVSDGDGGVIVGAAGQPGALLRVDAASGALRWRVDAVRGGAAAFQETSFDAAAVVSADGTVFAGASDGAFYSVALASGAVQHVWQLGARVRAAAVLPDSSEYVFVVTDGVPGVRPATLFKLRRDGSEGDDDDEPRAWRRPVCNDTQFDFAVGGLALSEAQGVVVACGSGQVELYSLLTGQERWRLFTGGRISAPPAIDVQSNSLYVAASAPDASSGALIRFDLAGEEVWRSEIRYAVDASPALLPAVPDAVLVLGRNGVLYRFDVAFGGVQSEQQVLPEGAISDFAPALGADGLVAFAAGADVTIVNGTDAGFAIVAVATLNETVTSAPLAADGAVFVATRLTPLLRLAVKPADNEEGPQPATLRRVLHPENEDDWPTAAIVVVVLLALLLLVLLGVLAAQFKKSRR